MKPFLLAGLFALAPLAAGTASAQRPIILPAVGNSFKMSRVGDLPPEVRQKVREETGRDLAVGYHYETVCVGSANGVFWTYPGEYVLYDDAEYFVPTGADWIALLGPDGAASLRRPLAYWFPPGLVVLVVGVVALAAAVYFSAGARAKRAAKDEKVQEGLAFFMAALPTETEPTQEDKRTALARTAAYLEVTHGIPYDRALKSLRLVVGEAERAHSHELRNNGLFHEEAGEWDEAARFYQLAAEVMADYDAKDSAFLLGCVQRVRDKQSRTHKG